MRGMLTLLVFISGCQTRELVEPEEAGQIRFVSRVNGFAATESGGADTKSLGTVKTGGAPSTFYLHGTESDWPVTDAPGTKSQPVTDVHSTMKVSGYSYSGAWDGTQLPNLFEGVTLTKSGSTWIGLNPKMQWPGAEYKVRFGAMSPAPGIGGLYWRSDGATAGMPVIEYTIPTTVSQQVDILECASAEYVGDGSTASSGVNMNFRHALTAVKVNISDFGFDAIVKSVSIDGVYNTGTHIIGENTWSGLSGSSSFLVSSLNKEITATGDFEIISAENTFLFLPQECPLGSTISITVSISGVDYIIKASLAGQRWEPGKEVIYSISPSEQDWTTVLKLLNINETVSQTGDLIATVLSYRKHVTGIKEPLPWSVQYKVDGSYQNNAPYAFCVHYSEQLGGWEGEDIFRR